MELLAIAGEDESLFVGQDLMGKQQIRSNLHNHSIRSDGQFSLRKLGAIAEKHSINIALSDHNIPPPDNEWYPGLVPGTEITVREGIDIVTWGTLREMHSLFEDVIRRKLVGRNWRFNPTKLAIPEFLEALDARHLKCNHAHYGTIEGLSGLPILEQHTILEKSRHFAFLELNALLRAYKNKLACLLAQKWSIPLIATGDTHRYERQHISTFTEISRDVLIEDSAQSLITRFLHTLHTQPHTNVLHHVPLHEKILTGAQIVSRAGLIPTLRFGKRLVERMVGLRPKAHAALCSSA
ncbi:hypothetical protein A3D11_00710 [Candidatus Peribacteria bacterium RIFCSPHIGHO2_02_FULL_49_16]|nr:MAG: hypothetical protein A2880_00505 [Candidatus Peribacteria bacterium RIFCSPHIGHO2_01_FULL_49_38]OGJ59127.1 MAG: hypothetical protein A3D11_00710 [Candidatus Peribacteria bacterium RIFCSPHIGHO2_02_FULL_49_16]